MSDNLVVVCSRQGQSTLDNDGRTLLEALAFVESLKERTEKWRKMFKETSECTLDTDLDPLLLRHSRVHHDLDGLSKLGADGRDVGLGGHRHWKYKPGSSQSNTQIKLPVVRTRPRKGPLKGI